RRGSPTMVDLNVGRSERWPIWRLADLEVADLNATYGAPTGETQSFGLPAPQVTALQYRRSALWSRNSQPQWSPGQARTVNRRGSERNSAAARAAACTGRRRPASFARRQRPSSSLSLTYSDCFAAASTNRATTAKDR